MALAVAPARAHAEDGQVAARVTVDSDFRWRGYSYSAGHPVASVDLSYDAVSGLYLNGSVVAEWRDGDPRYLGFDVGAGYAARLGERWSLDAGVERAQYRSAYPGGRDYKYTQLYVGVSHGPILARVFYSPNYLASHVQTLYFEAEGSLKLPAAFRLTGHAGVLSVIEQPPPPGRNRRTQYDWRVGISHPFGNAEAHVSLSGGGPGQQYYEDGYHSRTVVTVGASLSF